jgi:hypothetical protein
MLLKWVTTSFTNRRARGGTQRREGFNISQLPSFSVFSVPSVAKSSFFRTKRNDAIEVGPFASSEAMW